LRRKFCIMFQLLETFSPGPADSTVCLSKLPCAACGFVLQQLQQVVFTTNSSSGAWTYGLGMLGAGRLSILGKIRNPYWSSWSNRQLYRPTSRACLFTGIRSAFQNPNL